MTHNPNYNNQKLEQLANTLGDAQDQLFALLGKGKTRRELCRTMIWPDEELGDLTIYYRVIDAPMSPQTDESADSYTIEFTEQNEQPITISGRLEQTILNHLNEQDPLGAHNPNKRKKQQPEVKKHEHDIEVYRDYHIAHGGLGFVFAHDDYEGVTYCGEDIESIDPRAGSEYTLEDCKRRIDQIEEERQTGGDLDCDAIKEEMVLSIKGLLKELGFDAATAEVLCGQSDAVNIALKTLKKAGA